MSVGILLGAFLGCSDVNEEVRLVFPSSEEAELVERLVVTVLDPIVSNASGDETLVPCARLSTFAPLRALEVGAEVQTEDVPAHRVQQDFEYPLVHDLEFSFPRPVGTERNPWGATAVLVEARGPAVRFGTGPPQSRRPSTLLLGCYCVRTLSGRHPDSDLDAEVTAACPPIGGSQGTPQASREVIMAPPSSPEFELRVCSRGAAPEQGTMRPGPVACLVTRLCGDVPPGQSCFDCEAPCPELASLADAVVEFRSSGDLQPARQLVLTNRFGEARPALESRRCPIGSSASMEARIFGRPETSMPLDVRCVPAVGSVVHETSVRGLGDASRMAAVPSDDALVVLRSSSDPSDVPMTTAVVVSGPAATRTASVQLADRIGMDVVSFEAGAGRRFVAVASRWTRATDASDERIADHNVVIDVFSWNGVQLTAHAVLDQPCASCTCGSLDACAAQDDCGLGEACVEGRCQDALCSCELTVEPGELAELRAADVNADGLTDLTGATPRSGGFTTWYGQPEPPYFSTGHRSCECSKITPFNQSYHLLNFGAGPALDVALASDRGLQVRYGTETEALGFRIGCGGTERLGPSFEVRALRSIPLSCPAGATDCPGFDDLVFSDRRPLSEDPVFWVRGGEERAAGIRDLFEGSPRSGRLFSRADGVILGEVLEIQVGDVDGDGVRDLIWMHANRRRLTVTIGDGRGGFAETLGPPVDVVDLVEGAQSCDLLDEFVVQDMDRDGRDELVFACREGGALTILGLEP
ncbi:MAG: FG-GAP repeat domain-containing protein [Myxococcota bacterium]